MLVQLVRRRFSHAIFSLLILLVCGCSGGGGRSAGSAAETGSVIDPASSFTGASNAAVVTSGNAEGLALGGFYGARTGAVIGTLDSSIAKNTVAGAGIPARELVQKLKLAARRLAIPKKAVELRQSQAAGGGGKELERSVTFQVAGDNGGVASYSLEINDTTGSFTGSVNFQSYTSGNTTFNGICDMQGIFDASGQEVTQLTLSFKSLSMRQSSEYVLIGNISWTFAYFSSNETMDMNMVLKDVANSKAYWFKNYKVVTIYGSSSLTQSLTGRYYDHDFGYVDLSTDRGMEADYGASWPRQGTLNSSASGRWVKLIFLATTYRVQAETDGDGVADWQVEKPSNTVTAVNQPPQAQAGVDQSVTTGTTVQLNGSSSSDPEGDPLSYSWSFNTVPSGAVSPALTGADTITASFIPTVAGTYQLTLRVFDGSSMAYDSVTVTVAPPPAPPASHVFEKISGPVIWTYLRRTIAVDSLDQVYVTSGSTIFRIKNKQPEIFINAATIKAATGSSSDLNIKSLDIGPDDNLYFLEANSSKIFVSDQQGHVQMHRDLRGLPGSPQLIGVIDADTILLMHLYDGLYMVKGSGNTLLYDRSLVQGGTNCGTEDLAVGADGSFTYLPGCNGSPMLAGKSDGSGVGILLTNSISVGLGGWWNFSGVSTDNAGGFIANVSGSRILRTNAQGQNEIIHTDPELDALARTSEGSDMAFYYSPIAAGKTGNIYIISSTVLYVAHPR